MNTDLRTRAERVVEKIGPVHPESDVVVFAKFILSLLGNTEGLVGRLNAISVSAYPAHGSGFVLRFDGDDSAIQEAAALLHLQEQRINRAREALIMAEAFIAGTEPRLATDRDEAVFEVLPFVRATLKDLSP